MSIPVTIPRSSPCRSPSRSSRPTRPLDLGSRASRAAGSSRWGWIAGAALAMGGGIWSMHFVGMLAFEMGMPAAYDLATTLVSPRHRGGVHGRGLRLDQPAGADHPRPSRRRSGHGARGGRHALHRHGRRFGCRETSRTMRPCVGISVLIAVTAATAALWLTFRQISIAQKLVAACVMGIAVAGMHYTGMAAATFTAEAHGAHAASTLEGGPRPAEPRPGGGGRNLSDPVPGDARLLLRSASASSGTCAPARRASAPPCRPCAACSGRTTPAGGWSASSRAGAPSRGSPGPNTKASAGPRPCIPTMRRPASQPGTRRCGSAGPSCMSTGCAAPMVAGGTTPIRAGPDPRRAVRFRNGSACTPQSPSSARSRRNSANPTRRIQRYAYIVSHDLRAPLVNVMGFTSELEATRAEVAVALRGHSQAQRIDADMCEALGFIQAAVTRMESLIAAILKLSREETARLQARAPRHDGAAAPDRRCSSPPDGPGGCHLDRRPRSSDDHRRPPRDRTDLRQSRRQRGEVPRSRPAGRIEIRRRRWPWAGPLQRRGQRPGHRGAGPCPGLRAVPPAPGRRIGRGRGSGSPTSRHSCGRSAGASRWRRNWGSYNLRRDAAARDRYR